MDPWIFVKTLKLLTADDLCGADLQRLPLAGGVVNLRAEHHPAPRGLLLAPGHVRSAPQGLAEPVLHVHIAFLDRTTSGWWIGREIQWRCRTNHPCNYGKPSVETSLWVSLLFLQCLCCIVRYRRKTNLSAQRRTNHWHSIGFKTKLMLWFVFLSLDMTHHYVKLYVQ